MKRISLFTLSAFFALSACAQAGTAKSVVPQGAATPYVSNNDIRFNKAEQLFSINGKNSAHIKVTNTDTSGVKNRDEFKNGSSAGVFTMN